MVTAWIPKFPKCIVTCIVYFAQALTSEIINSGEMLGTPIECHTFVIFDDAGQKRKQVSINSIQFENNKHHYRNFNKSLEMLDWLLHRPEFWLRFLLRLELKILTPAPAPVENPNSGWSLLRNSDSVIISALCLCTWRVVQRWSLSGLPVGYPAG